MGLMMIPDATGPFPELSDGISKANYLPDFIYNDIVECFDFSEFDNLLHSDNSSLDEDLYPTGFDTNDGFDILSDADYMYNLHEEPYNEKSYEATALKSSLTSISPELTYIVNPNDVFNHIHIKKEVVQVTDDVAVNNKAPRRHLDFDYEYVRNDNEVHNDHSYVKEESERPVVQYRQPQMVRIKQEVESDEEYEPPRSVAVKMEPPVKRPVGRPRKVPVPPAVKQIKRTVVHIEDANSDEYVDVESLDVKRPRRAPKSKSSPKKTPKSKGKGPISPEHPSTFQQIIDPFNPNGYVMRQAKTSALKKITKPKGQQKSPTVPRSKRSDHNDMERKRRHEMRDLFEQLKKLVPVELLVDDNKKIKKNPSKNTILCGSQKYVELLCATKKVKNSLVRDNLKLQKKHRRLVKSLRKHYKSLPRWSEY